MNMLWEHRLPLARGAAGSVGDIFCHDGMAFAVVDENACTRWHVAAFDMQGTPADMRRESLIRARGYAFSSGMLLAQGLTGTCLYSLPDLRETPLPFSADAVSRWNFPRPVPAEGVPYFVAAAFRDGGDARLAAFSRSGRLLWRQELAAFSQVDCLLLTDRFVVAGSRSRQNGATSLFILSVTGERLKVITLDSRYEDKLFRTLGGHMLPLGSEDVLMLGDDAAGRLRLARVSLRSGSARAVSLSRAHTGTGRLYALPDGSMALLSSGILLLDRELRPLARFPVEEYPDLCLGALAPTPDGHFLLGGARMSSGFTPWLGKFARTGFTPCAEPGAADAAHDKERS